MQQTPPDISLVVPTVEHLPSYVAALNSGWSPDNVRGRAAAEEQLRAIERDPAAFLASFDDPEGLLPPVRQPDGTTKPRLPGIGRWIWDGEFCGSIGFRWSRDGGPELPPYVLGHIGFSLVPWKRAKGIATRALALMLEEPRRMALPYVEITTTADNVPSRKVIEANGGVLVETFRQPDAHGGEDVLRFRMALS